VPGRECQPPRFRAPTPDDAAAVAEILIARERADTGVADYTLEALRDEWSESEFDLAADAIVVEAGEQGIVAYAIGWRPGTLAVVSPDFEGRGVGAQLLEWTQRNDREHGRSRHRQWVGSKNARARALLERAGYTQVRSYWRMIRPLSETEPEVTVPFGVRAVDPARDAEALHACDRAAFSSAPDYEPESLTSFTEVHLGTHDFAPGLSLVAEDDGGRIAGFLLACRWPHEPIGYVDVLAVHPDFRRRGLGTAMLQTAFARFAAEGLKEAQLGVASDNPTALRLYERIGMTPRRRVDTYERALTAVGSA